MWEKIITVEFSKFYLYQEPVHKLKVTKIEGDERTKGDGSRH